MGCESPPSEPADREEGELRGDVLAGARIRQLRPEDLPAVLRIEEASFEAPWSEWAFRALFRRRDAVLLAAELPAGVDREDGEGAWTMVGYAAAWFASGEGELGDLAVAPDARRRGVGRALVRAVKEETRRRGGTGLFLQVRESNEAARSLYLDEGFKRVGRRKRYYRSPAEDALILRWSPAREAR